MKQNKETVKNEKRILIWGVVILVIALGILLYNYPFYQSIDQTVTATVYVNGIAADTTAVTMSGKKSNYVLRSEEYYTGSFDIACYPGTNSSYAMTDIRWYKKHGYGITYWNKNAGITARIDGPSILYISEDMTEFVLRDRDNGTLIATAEDLLHLHAGFYLPDTQQ